MEQAVRSPSDIHSFSLNKSVIDLSKKRKLTGDQFGLPIPKHKCWNHRISPKPLHTLQLVDNLAARFAKDEAEEPSIYLVSEPVESVKDSNSFVGDNDCSMSESSDAKFESNALIQCSSTATSIFGDLSCTNVKDYRISDATAAGDYAGTEPVCEVEEHDPCNYFYEIQEYQNLDAGNVEVDGLEPFKSLDKILHFNKTNPDIPALSINQDAESVRKPTIDQEFEEYFSALIL